MIVVENDETELIPNKVYHWRENLHRLMKIKQYHKERSLPLPFIDQMLGMLIGKVCYHFFDGCSSYNQIAIAPEDQEKIKFGYPYGAFPCRRMYFGLCNSFSIFQRFVMTLFSDLIKYSI